MSVFKDVQENVRELDRQATAFQRSVQRLCEWEDPDDVLQYRKEGRDEERARNLDRIVPDRRCPACGELVPESTRWVMNVKQTHAVCRSCFNAGIKGTLPKSLQELGDLRILYAPIVRWKIDGADLVKVREALNCTRKHFARKAGWTYSYQHELERGTVSTISQDTADTIMTVLSELSDKLNVKVFSVSH